jgi:hypothetical protein
MKYSVRAGEFTSTSKRRIIMATAKPKKTAAKGSTGVKNSSGGKGARKKGRTTKADQLPPIIVKGGSINIAYEHGRFPRVGVTNNHVRPSGAEIFQVEVEIPSGTLPTTFSVPTGGDCQITIRLRTP